VTCDCENHLLAAEAGRTSAEKYRIRGLSKVDALLVCPYQEHNTLGDGGDEYSMYVFQKPDADIDWPSVVDS